jgi:tRNA threonylcarbamoyladenosine biosynthesis protein TsaB
MKLLAIDTSTEACSVAVLIDDIVHERFEIVSQRHSERILPLVDAVLAETGLALSQFDALAFGRGPGSFTALRIGAGVVQGLAFGADLPVVPVSSLAALAQGQDADRILAAFDARMGQIYWAPYVRETGLVRALGDEQVQAPETVALAGTGWVGAGSGWDQYGERLLARLSAQVLRWQPQCYPHAGDVARLALHAYARGEAVAAEDALPIYVRDEVAVKASR